MFAGCWLGPAMGIGGCVCTGPGVLASASVVCSLSASIALRDWSELLPLALLLPVSAERPNTERLSRLREVDRSRPDAGGGGGNDGAPDGEDVLPDGLWLRNPMRGEDVFCGEANAPLERAGEPPMAADMLCCPGFGEYGGGGEGMFASMPVASLVFPLSAPLDEGPACGMYCPLACGPCLPHSCGLYEVITADDGPRNAIGLETLDALVGAVDGCEGGLEEAAYGEKGRADGGDTAEAGVCR